jgi:5'-nucleotidase
MKRVTTALIALAALLLLAVPATAGAKDGPSSRAEDRAQKTHIQILGLNDFHGNLRPPDETSSSGRIGPALPAGVAAGGVEYLATHVRQLRATNPNTLFVSAGDLIGASPLISAAFHDEPTIEAFNLMGLDYNGVGNHEFDEGVPELLRMQNGGCHPVDGCFGGDGFAGATFQFLAANVTYKADGETIFPPYAIHHFPGVKVAVVGMTLEGTPAVVTAAAVADIDFHDEADSVNALVPHLKKQGVETIVVLLHEGGSTSTAGNGAGSITGINACVAPSGPIVDVVDRMSDEIDVVVTGHTNWAVNCVLDGKIMTGAASFGRLVTDIDLTVSRASKEVVAATVNNVIVTRTVDSATWAPDVRALVAKYSELAAPTENRLIGNAQAALTRASTAPPAGNGESVLGDIIADAQLWATSQPGFPVPPAVVSFMNPGGIRADINAGPITYGEAFSVQPFGNILVTMTMTGAQIDAVLEQQTAGTTLQIPASLTYDRSAGAAAGNRISNIKINGVAVNPLLPYRVTVNNFLADGGDGFTVFRQGTDRYFGEIDLDAFARYLELPANNPISPTPRNRINLVP